MHTTSRFPHHPALATLAVAFLAATLGACTVGGGSSDGSDDDDDDGTTGTGGADPGTTDGVCVSTNQTDLSLCDDDCDVAVAGDDGVYECTVSCDLDVDDCGSGNLCVEQSDGTGACLEDCSADGVCSDAGDRCDPDLYICFPGEASSTDGFCDPANVSDPETCDADCDTYVEGADGVYQCTLTCDPEAQDCGDDVFYCQGFEDGGGVCVYDCRDHACPSDYTCDDEYEICVPDSVSG